MELKKTYYTYADLPEIEIPQIHHSLNDDLILEHLNTIVDNANLLEKIELVETSGDLDNPPSITITFKILKRVKQ